MDFCADLHSDVLTINTKDEQEFVTKYLVEASENIWLDAANSKYDNWINNTAITQVGCAVVFKLKRDTSKWVKDICENQNEVVCKRSVSVTPTELPTTTLKYTTIVTTETTKASTTTQSPRHCEQGWTQFGDRCFKFFNNSVNFLNAEKTCKSLNSHTTSIHSETESKFIVNTPGFNGYIWIGGTRNGSLIYVDFEWLDKSPKNYKPAVMYASYSYDCMVLSTRSDQALSWHYASCSGLHYYVCSKKLK